MIHKIKNSDIDEILAINDDNNISLEDINIDDLTVDNINKSQNKIVFIFLYMITLSMTYCQMITR